ncbi:hypothetical protein T8K17_13400 [Thalassobaculum sp. OXR-137]|uniref:hypothetical protein n=1 Tax=Thalassobaculum sp. OXR-137 TaxID=3100173 RepID=UPI002AC8E846|nr:hypothetical protein [Thalassobaculum sp. OXR-137]WPZ32238.1 hypothetical protein T8K17_13400 [Thalassobaculum sp. OXR-137]
MSSATSSREWTICSALELVALVLVPYQKGSSSYERLKKEYIISLYEDLDLFQVTEKQELIAIGNKTFLSRKKIPIAWLAQTRAAREREALS